MPISAVVTQVTLRSPHSCGVMIKTSIYLYGVKGILVIRLEILSVFKLHYKLTNHERDTSKVLMKCYSLVVVYLHGYIRRKNKV